jgi:hypothetical protein
MAIISAFSRPLLESIEAPSVAVATIAVVVFGFVAVIDRFDGVTDRAPCVPRLFLTLIR